MMPSLNSSLLHAGAQTSTLIDILGVNRTQTPSIGCYEEFIDIAPPVIEFTAVKNASLAASRQFSAHISDVLSGVDTLNYRPRLYYKKASQANNSDSWQYSVASGPAPDFNFTFDYSKIGGVKLGDVIQYFVIAQDLAPKANIGFNSGYSFEDLTNLDLQDNAFPIYDYNSYLIAPSISGIKTVGAGGDYLSLTGDNKGVFKALANSVVVGDISFQIFDDLSESAVNELNSITREGGDWKINIVPDGANSRIIRGQGKNTFGGLIRIKNVKNINIDGSIPSNTGRFLTFTDAVQNLSNKVPIIQISGAGNGDGCNNINIKNVNVIGSNNSDGNANSYCIFIGNNDLSATSNSTNNNISIVNSSLTRAAYGIYTGASIKSSNNNLIFKNNIIGSSDPSQYITMTGACFNGFSNLTVSENEVMNIISSNSSWNIGININDYCDSARVEKNIIHGCSYSGTVNGSGQGLGVFGASNYVVISNNTIYDIKGSGSSVGISQANPCAIRLAGGRNHKVYYNSVNLFGEYLSSSNTSATSYALAIHSENQDSLVIKNNSFVNTMTKANVLDGGSYALAILSSVYHYTNTVSNNNNLYSNPNNTALQKVGYSGVNNISLTNWQNATGLDFNSKSLDPLYYQPNILIPIQGSPLLLSAANIPSVQIDAVNNQRDVNFPTIGAYEKEFTPTLPSVVTNPIVSLITQYTASSSGSIINQGRFQYN